ncbi:allophanate hydrolase subunit 2 [Lucifera butyrica]|uniref:Allophanate hydrolase subunit 2 n=1 Tax=Lucifera butyrica TaxID=1351585 RepID=A0A498RI84_9FIRM|nr:biotin-dependent carboxyltransferase family protein [Lucifera butyrica]VBB09802.1 allophanate hydrolase subunit 2 [Lucifera butyrica]
MITVLQSGQFTTVQDEGRWGYQAFGMPIAGAMDRYACRVANLLAGNPVSAAVLEMTAEGAAFQFDTAQLVAVCGADMQGTLNGEAIRNWSSFRVPPGGEIRFGPATAGCRTYLAVQGGIAVSPVLGSRSTYSRAKIGGYEGRALLPGDVLEIGRERNFAARPQALDGPYIPCYPDSVTLRVLPGPQDTMFAPETVETFLTGVYTVTGRADRAGYQLQGPRIMAMGKADIISDAACLGAIQIPAGGQPFIMMADHQTTGGFAKIGYVIRADLTRLAQARPGDTIRFAAVTEAGAVAALRQRRQCYSEIATLCRKNSEKEPTASIKSNGPI